MNDNHIYCYAVCKESMRRGIDDGIWIEPLLGIEVMGKQIEGMLSRSRFYPKTGWQVTKYRTPWGGGCIADEVDLNSLHDMADFIYKLDYFEKLGELGCALLNHFNGDLPQAEDALNNCYKGDYESEIEFIKTKVKHDGRLPGHIIDGLNYDKLWEMWSQERYISFHLKRDNRVYIFRR